MNNKIIIISGMGQPALAALNIYSRNLEDFKIDIIFEKKSLIHTLKILYKQYKRAGFFHLIGFVFLQMLGVTSKYKYKYSDYEYTRLVENINTSTTLDFIKKIDPDVIVTNACSILSEETLISLAKYKILNVHNGINPRYRGTGNIWAILEKNFSLIGVTVHEVDAGIDTGKILANKKLPISSVKELDCLAFEAGSLLICNYLSGKKITCEVDVSNLTSQCYSFPNLFDYWQSERIVCEQQNSQNNIEKSWKNKFNEQAQNASLSSLEQQCWSNVNTVKWHDQKIIDFISQNKINIECTVLDVGCGDVRYAALLPENFEYIGMDYSINLLGNFKRANLVCADSGSFPFRNSVMDVIVSVGMLQHLKEVGKVLDGIFNISNKDSCIVVINTLRELSLLELILLYPASNIITQYKPLILERLKYKFCKNIGEECFSRHSSKIIQQQIEKLYKVKSKIEFNGVFGTRIFSTEFIIYLQK